MTEPVLELAGFSTGSAQLLTVERVGPVSKLAGAKGPSRLGGYSHTFLKIQYMKILRLGTVIKEVQRVNDDLTCAAANRSDVLSFFIHVDWLTCNNGTKRKHSQPAAGLDSFLPVL